ncbi:MAG TPA: hypothetical protein VGR63_19100 [Casimicrobiaceae bacterium]|jgi:hypothetical protein|nr:hypothetical protein [Casimicrobiaceae bacterium]
MTVVAVLQWWRARRRRGHEMERRRAEALVEVERRGMMGGRPHELRIRPAPTRQRLPPAAPLAIEHEEGEPL